MNKLYLLGIFLVAGILFLGCTGAGIGGGSANNATPMSLIPAKANAYIEVHLKNVLADPDIQAQMAQAGASASYQQSLNQIKSMGVDPTTVDDVVLFTNTNDQSSTGYSGLIAKVKVDEATFVAAMNKQAAANGGSALKKTTYGTTTIYTSDQAGGLAFLSGDIVVAGSTLQATEDIVDVSTGKASALNSATLNSVASKLDSNAMIIAVATIPDSMKASLQQQPSNSGGISFDSFKSLQAAGLSLNKQGSTYTYTVAAKLGSESDATTSKKVIDSAVTLYGQALASQQGGAAVAAILNKVQTTASGDTLVVSLSVTTADIQQLEALAASAEGASSSGSTGGYDNTSGYGS